MLGQNKRRANDGAIDGSHSVIAERIGDAVATTVSGDSFLESISENILNIFLKSFKEEESTVGADSLMTLCSVSCVSRTLHTSVNKTISSLTSLNLSAFPLSSKTFDGLAKRFGKIKKITLNCLRLNKVSSIISLLGPDVEELVLLKCCSLPYHRILKHIGKSCPNLRVLTLEISGYIDTPDYLDEYLETLLGRCRCLEALQIKAVGGEFYKYTLSLTDIYDDLPQSIKVLRIQSVTIWDMFTGTHIACPTYGRTLTNISLVLNVITDHFLHTIANCLPLLVELDLKDEPVSKPLDDMSDEGVHSLVGCRNLTSLSLIRHLHKFSKTTDVGMFSLSEGCKGLISVRLGGFSQVSDAGFTSILNSCSNLKKFEIQYAPLLTDLTFQDVSNICRSLVEVKLESCDSVTSKAVHELASCSSLEVLDLPCCRNVGDSCLYSISCLTLLTSLNLEETDVTDSCMAFLGKGNAPISRLTLRGCERVTDKGIAFLLGGEGKITKSLSSLNLGQMPGITDNAITTIANVCVSLEELCIQSCFHVTDAAVKALAIKGSTQSESKLLRRLDLYQCTALSSKCFEYLRKPIFRGLLWIGTGETRLIGVGNRGFAKVYRDWNWRDHGLLFAPMVVRLDVMMDGNITSLTWLLVLMSDRTGKYSSYV